MAQARDQKSASTIFEMSNVIKLRNNLVEVLVLLANQLDRHLPQILRINNFIYEYFNICKTFWNRNFNANMNCVILGFFMCFYGGSFPALFTTATAILQSGQWNTLKKGVITAYNQFKKACGVIQEDEIIKALDKNEDGKVSLEEIVVGLNKGGKGLLVTVIPLVMERVDPNVMNEAIISIGAIWCTVMITLKSIFARQVTMGMQVGDVVFGSVKNHIAPAVIESVGKEYKVWAEYGVLIGCKFGGVLLAMFLARLVGGFTCAMQGGGIIAKGMMPITCHYFSLSQHDMKTWKSVTTYTIGGIGFLYQLASGFSMNIIFKLLFAPAVIAEMVIGFLMYTG